MSIKIQPFIFTQHQIHSVRQADGDPEVVWGADPGGETSAAWWLPLVHGWSVPTLPLCGAQSQVSYHTFMHLHVVRGVCIALLVVFEVCVGYPNLMLLLKSWQSGNKNSHQSTWYFSKILRFFPKKVLLACLQIQRSRIQGWCQPSRWVRPHSVKFVSPL